MWVTIATNWPPISIDDSVIKMEVNNSIYNGNIFIEVSKNVNHHYTNMPCQCGYPDGMSPRGRMVFPKDGALGKTILPLGDIPSRYPHWHGIFVLLYRTNTNLVKYQWKQQWLPVDPVRTVEVLPVDISLVDMMEWPTFVSQSRLTIFTWGIIKQNVNHQIRMLTIKSEC